MRKEHKSIADAFRDLERMGYLIKSIGIHKEGDLKVICRPRKEDDGEKDAFQEALKQGYGIDESSGGVLSVDGISETFRP